ncbi:unnamed protein product [Rhizoctonia solani]|uniref:Uncharacterized protein n=1 Tax=Rhizoctonia solani TaxID=456999 RepID=A0A8H2WCC1_9AGAM|nr:unnamed protein product [Rhizoctonia solani]
MAPPNVDPVMWSTLMVFQRFQVAAQSGQDKSVGRELTRLRSPTVGRSSNPTDSMEEEPTDTHQGAVLSVVPRILPTPRTSESPEPPLHLQNPGKARSKTNKHIGATPCAFARRDKRAKRVRAPTASPARSRSQSPPLPSNCKRHCSPSPQPGLSKRSQNRCHNTHTTRAQPRTSKSDHVEVNDEESDNDSESGTAREMTKGALKNTGKKAKSTKSTSPPPDDLEPELESQKATKGPRPKGPPKEIDGPEEAPEEPESPPPRKARTRPTPKSPPPQEDDKPPPLPPSLFHPPATAPEVGLSKASDNEGIRSIAQTDMQELIKLGKAKAVGTVKIKCPVPHSNRTLRERK